MDDDSGDDEGEKDWLRQGWRSETGSLFQRWGDACRNERFVFSTRSWLEGVQESQQRKYEYSEEVGERRGYAGKRIEWLWEL